MYAWIAFPVFISSKLHHKVFDWVFRKLSTAIALWMTLSKLFYNKKFYFTVDDWLLPTLIIFLEYLKFESGEYQHNFLL